MDECFFNSLVVGVPCSLIFWQFWLFIVLKWDVILHLDVQGSEAFLRMPPSWPAKSLIPFEFILVYGVIWWSSFIFLHICPDVPTPFVEEAVFTPFYFSASFVKY